MNIPDKIFDLLKLLDKKTIERKLTWSQTSRETEYSVIFKDGSTLTIDRWIGEGVKCADFVVYNNSGKSIERVFANVIESEQEYDVLSNVYDHVIDAVFKRDETINNLFNELGNL